LGAELASIGREGFRSYSAKLSDQEVLIVFPQNLLPGSWVKFWDPVTRITQIIPSGMNISETVS
jgi:hypothetical protein